jgi:hypothetical protein
MPTRGDHFPKSAPKGVLRLPIKVDYDIPAKDDVE